MYKRSRFVGDGEGIPEETREEREVEDLARLLLNCEKMSTVFLSFTGVLCVCVLQHASFLLNLIDPSLIYLAQDISFRVDLKFLSLKNRSSLQIQRSFSLLASLRNRA